MLTQSSRSLLNLPTQNRVVPVVETRIQFVQALEVSQVRAMLLRHCNLFEFTALLESAHRCGCSVYVNVDHIDGIHADTAGLRYIAERLRVTGIVSNHPKILSIGKQFGLETIQRIFAVDSTGLEMALESVDTAYVDVLDFSPALVVPYVIPQLKSSFPLPFMASGLLYTAEQLQAVLRAGVQAVAVTRPELWM
ncbi:MAG TPA: glycerol-3-phosphate responsive antiterminator [Ktedonobacteraceae bacterium]|nr:glycerol-3-phosphate responsive antiterminator [Ktedonobacteraceae bacterium]